MFDDLDYGDVVRARDSTREIARQVPRNKEDAVSQAAHYGAAAAGAAIGTLIGGPLGTMVGGAVGPLISEGISWILSGLTDSKADREAEIKRASAYHSRWLQGAEAAAYAPTWPSYDPEKAFAAFVFWHHWMKGRKKWPRGMMEVPAGLPQWAKIKSRHLYLESTRQAWMRSFRKWWIGVQADAAKLRELELSWEAEHEARHGYMVGMVPPEEIQRRGPPPVPAPPPIPGSQLELGAHESKPWLPVAAAAAAFLVTR